jgi:hypothetical protein
MVDETGETTFDWDHRLGLFNMNGGLQTCSGRKIRAKSGAEPKHLGIP